MTNADYSGSRSAVFGQIVFVSEASQSSAVHLLWVISYPATTYIFRSLFSTINLKAVQPKYIAQFGNDRRPPAGDEIQGFRHPPIQGGEKFPNFCPLVEAIISNPVTDWKQPSNHMQSRRRDPIF